MIESPKPRLKAIQRFLLAQIIERIPPHEAAHGFRKGRSIATFTPQHVGRELVLGLAALAPDIADDLLSRWVVTKHVYVAETDARARQEAEKHERWYLDSFARSLRVPASRIYPASTIWP